MNRKNLLFALCFFLSASLFLLPACSKSSGGSSSGVASFFLTDGPSDKLSSLQIQLDGLSIKSLSGAVTQVFPGPGGQPVNINLLSLRGVNRLLANSSLAPGLYREIQLTYSKAKAVDNNGNALAVTPDTGTVRILFNPPLNIGHLEVESNGQSGFDDDFGHRNFDSEHFPEAPEQNQTGIKIDFDVDNSIDALVSGPGGSLSLRPTIIVHLERSGQQEMDEFKGAIASFTADGFFLRVGTGQIQVKLQAGALLDAMGNMSNFSGGLNLSTLFQVGSRVEIKGKLDGPTNTFLADKVEAEDGQSGFSGSYFKGLVSAIQTNSFSVVVLESGNSGLAIGSTQSVSHNGTTRFVYSRAKGAGASSLALGQEVGVVGSPNVLQPQLVKLKSTKIKGTVASVGTNSATINVASIEGLNVSQISGFTNPLSVSFSGALPAFVSLNAQVELEGLFNFTTPGGFDVKPSSGQGLPSFSEFEGTTFSFVSPGILSITGDGTSLGLSNPVTIKVSYSSTTVMVERNKATFTIISLSPSDLDKALQSGRYGKLKIKGQYNSANNTLTASFLRADLP